LNPLQHGTYLDHKEKEIKYSDFVNKELILFSRADLQRSIPSVVDGLKPGQRKILFCAFKRNFVKEAKVCVIFLSILVLCDYNSMFSLLDLYLHFRWLNSLVMFLSIQLTIMVNKVLPVR